MLACHRARPRPGARRATKPSWRRSKRTRATSRASAATEKYSRADGKANRIHRVSARAAGRPRAGRARARLERVPSPHGGEAPAPAGRALHGLRRAVLPHGQADQRHGLRLPDQQPDPRVERPRLSRPVARGARAPAPDQQLPGVHRPRLPGAVRRLVRARHQRAAGDDQEHRERDHRPRLGGRLGRAASRRRRAPARRSRSSAPAPRVSPPPRSSTRPATS